MRLRAVLVTLLVVVLAAGTTSFAKDGATGAKSGAQAMVTDEHQVEIRRLEERDDFLGRRADLRLAAAGRQRP